MSAASVAPVVRSRTNGSVRSAFESESIRLLASDEKPTRDPSKEIDGGPAAPSGAAGVGGTACAARAERAARAARAGSMPPAKISGGGPRGTPQAAPRPSAAQDSQL